MAMRKRTSIVSRITVYIATFGVLLLTTAFTSRYVSTLTAQKNLGSRCCIIIDPGHGGVDGGATSCNGVLESEINLQIALRLNDLMHFLGLNTIIIRDTDRSVYTQGNTIAQKKVSDLKERVRIVNEQSNALLVSIHQNHFTLPQYNGAQVFYAPTAGSREVAGRLQESFIQYLNPTSHRQIKKADGVYLMQHINCTGVLIECGFLSNPKEEYLLRDTAYQQKISCIIASTVSCWLFNT
jgi:N-acetylmuramoyl-L-alanine amidase